MAVDRQEGFVHFTSTADWQAKGHSVSGATVVFSPTTGRGGRGEMKLGLNSNTYITLLNPDEQTFLHCAWKSDNREGAQIFAWRNAVCDHLVLKSQGDGSLILYKSSGLFGTDRFNLTGATVLYTSGTNVVRNDTFHHFQIDTLIDASAGHIIITCDGIEVINYSGNTYSGTGAVTTTQIGFGWALTFNHYSDLVITNDEDGVHDSLLGDLAVYEAVTPVDGDLLEWDRSVASGNWSDYVDDNPQDGDTTYVVSDTPTERVCFSFPVVSASIGTIIAVKQTVCHAKEEPTTAAIKLFSRSTDDINHDGDVKPCTEDYIFDERIYDLDPKDDSAWDADKVNDTQLGILNYSA